MNKNSFFYFTLLQINGNRSKYFPLFIISIVLISIFSAFLFLSESIKRDITITLEQQPDFIVQRMLSGKTVDTPDEWVDSILAVDGVSKVTSRVYGRYYYEPYEHYFTIVGVDFFDKQMISNLKNIVNELDIKNFLSKDHMIVGEGVKRFLKEYHFFKYYNFRPPDKSIKKVYIYDKFNDTNNIVSSDMIIMDINLAKEILGIKQGYSTDIVYQVPNIDEKENIKNKIRAMSGFDIRILSKEDLVKVYEGFNNYKSSVFMVLYLIVLLSLILILYQRYTFINSIERKDVGILRALGWSMPQIILLKVVENIIVFSFAFLIAVNIGYFYVFVLDAPVLSGIFLGISNLPYQTTFLPVVDLGVLLNIYLFFIVPIVGAIIFPLWKISILDPNEAMR